jgi:hypothetical protein
MSKKHKSTRKQPPPVKKKTVAPPPAIKAKNGAERPVTPPVQKTMPPPAPIAKTEPASARRERETALPFWARLPFAMMDFWMARAARKDTESESRS